MYIGSYQLSNNLIVAPMAGVTDRPFRTLCKYFGAGHAVSEMMTADKTLRMTKKVFIVQTLTVNWLQFRHKLRVLTQSNWPRQHVIRWQMARRLSISIWDVPQKVCNKLAGSALLQDEDLVARIFRRCSCGR